MFYVRMVHFQKPDPWQAFAHSGGGGGGCVCTKFKFCLSLAKMFLVSYNIQNKAVLRSSSLLSPQNKCVKMFF